MGGGDEVSERAIVLSGGDYRYVFFIGSRSGGRFNYQCRSDLHSRQHSDNYYRSIYY